MLNELDRLIRFKPTGLRAGKGRLLLSEPFIPEAIFKRSVLLLADHGNSNSFGLIINKPTEYFISDVAFDFVGVEIPVYLGGPVESDHLFYLHTCSEIAESLEILPGLFWGGNFQQIKSLIVLNKLNAGNFRFFLGYAGWSNKQLDDELLKDSWIVSKALLSDIFSEQPDELWKSVIKRYGQRYINWLKIPVNPQLN